MEKNRDEASSLATSVPPNRLMALAPVAPSCPPPLSTTAIARGPATIASVARSRSADGRRSEEHTSELQSRQYLVCRLLLEKKKNHFVKDGKKTLLHLALAP